MNLPSLRTTRLATLTLVAAILSSGPVRAASDNAGPQVGDPLPVFETARLDDATRLESPRFLAGKVWVLSAWASWCTACREENALLKTLTQGKKTTLVGLDYLDPRESAQKWLTRYGNPFSTVWFDGAGHAGAALGITALPETWVIDRKGIVRYRHTGALSQAELQRTLLPLIRSLENG